MRLVHVAVFLFGAAFALALCWLRPGTSQENRLAAIIVAALALAVLLIAYV